MSIHSSSFQRTAVAITICILTLAACGGGDGSSTTSSSMTSTTVNPKKGFGLTETTLTANNPSVSLPRLLKNLNVAWYYNWGASTQLVNTATFVPMSFGISDISQIPFGTATALSFNEPDNSNQSNLSVTAAISAWPELAAKVSVLGAPATASDPLASGSWLSNFLGTSPAPSVDFVTVHWYKGSDSVRFENDIQSICNTFRKPVWVTEFAPQTVSESNANPIKYTQDQVSAFINTVVPWMNSNGCVQRYAWHDSKIGTSALFNASTGTPTATGFAYSAAQ